jgi:disulfide bond formation protein DsbB
LKDFAMIMSWLRCTRLIFSAICLFCIGLLSFGMYLQYVVGVEPCPMCIVQRYAMIGVAVLALLGAILGRSMTMRWLMGLLVILSSLGGAFVAARQSWLQWYPPEIATCGRDFYGMIESFPLSRAIPMIFRGGGDCTQVDWTFLGGSIANWSFVCFVLMALLMLVSLVASRLSGTKHD